MSVADRLLVPPKSPSLTPKTLLGVNKTVLGATGNGAGTNKKCLVASRFSERPSGRPDGASRFSPSHLARTPGSPSATSRPLHALIGFRALRLRLPRRAGDPVTAAVRETLHEGSNALRRKPRKVVKEGRANHQRGLDESFNPLE